MLTLKHIGISLAVTSLCSLTTLSSYANAPSNPRSVADEFAQWRQQTKETFQQYLDENDRAFIGFLKESWDPVELKRPEQQNTEPKPVELPKAPVIKVPKVKEPIANEPNIDSQPQATPTPPLTVPPPKVAITPLAPSQQPSAEFNFYGYAIEVPYDTKLIKPAKGSPNSDMIANQWQSMALSNFQPTVERLLQIQHELQLSDWAMLQLTAAFSGTLYPRDDNSRSLLSWFLLVKSGYDARVAFNNSILLLMPADEPVFGVTYFTLNDKRYYTLNNALQSPDKRPYSSSQAYTYQGQYDAARTQMRFIPADAFMARGEPKVRQLTFTDAGQEWRVDIPYTDAQIAYLNSLPQLPLRRYFRAGLPANAKDALLTQLRPMINGQSEVVAVNRLLRFVQTAFAYQTDEQQFHYENYLFPLETLYYPYSDCEDRAALFAWLTETLLNLDVVILDYPGHVATAVAFTEPAVGSSINFGGKHYTIADPTYVNATAGMGMPQYEQVQPKVEAF